MEHELKTDPIEFDAIVAGRKSFELRFNDRNYQIDDILILRKTRYTGKEMKKGRPLEYISPPFWLYVRYILKGPHYGLKDGWVAMAIMPRDTRG